MTYGDKIRSMNDKELAELLSCMIPEDDIEPMFIYGVGFFRCTKDLADKLSEQMEG